MRKQVKKRVPKNLNKKIDGDQIEAIQCKFFEESGELQMYFNFSNKALKMLKAGHGFQRSFLKNGLKTNMHFLHRDVFDEKHSASVDLRQRLAKEKNKAEVEPIVEPEAGNTDS